MDNDKLNLGTFVPKDTSSRFVEPRYRDAPKRSRDGQSGAHEKHVCFFSRVDIHPSKFDMDIHDCCIFNQ